LKCFKNKNKNIGEGPRASKIRGDFKMSDNKFWWIRVKALGQRKDWEAVNKHE